MEDHTVIRPSKTRSESTIIASLSVSLDELKQKADAQRKAFSAMEERLQSQFDRLKDTEQKFNSLNKYTEDAKQKLTEQLKFEVLDRFCEGNTTFPLRRFDNLLIRRPSADQYPAEEHQRSRNSTVHSISRTGKLDIGIWYANSCSRD